MTRNARRLMFVVAVVGACALTTPLKGEIQITAIPIPFDAGQNVAPVFEGWEANPDGSFEMVFGYLNRNYKEEPEIPIGPDNNIEPGGPDQGQPTHFYPRRQQFMFKVRVPADFGKKEITWTLTRNGRTDKAVGSLVMEYELSELVLASNRGGGGGVDGVVMKPNKAPTITISSPAQQTVAVGAGLMLTASASDDGNPEPRKASAPAPASTAKPNTPPPALVTIRTAAPRTQQVVKPNRDGLAVTWTHYRGPGKATFDTMSALVKDGKATTKVSFSHPGMHRIRAYADDGVLLGTADVDVTVTGSPSTSSNQP
jgi:hypothetical protein